MAAFLPWVESCSIGKPPTPLSRTIDPLPGLDSRKYTAAGMPLGEFLEGTGFLVLVVGSAVGLGWAVTSRRFGHLHGAPRFLAFSVFAVLGFVGAHLLPGALGLLSRGSVALSSLVLVAAATRLPVVRPAAPSQAPMYPPGPPSGRLSWLLAGVGVVAFGTYLLALAIDHGSEAIQAEDMNVFHLPTIVEWIRTGSLWHVTDFVPGGAFGAYPHTSDVVTLGVILPFRNDFLVHFVNYPALLVTGVAVYAIARELTAPAAPAVLFATGPLAIPMVTGIAFDGLADTWMYATFATGLLFLMRQLRTSARSDLVLAALALGTSFGTKWYAPPAVAIALLGWAGLTLLKRVDRRELLWGAGVLVGVIAAVGGFWLLRNLVVFGDPVFPAKVQVDGITIFDAPRDPRRDLYGSTLADYLDQPGVWRHTLWPVFMRFMTWLSVLLWAILPLAGLIAWRRARRAGPAVADRAHAVLGCLAIAAGIGLVFVVTPYSALGPAGNPWLAWASGRYVIPALLIGAALGAWVSGRLGRLRPLLEVGALIALLHAVSRNTHVSAKATAVAALAVALVAAAWVAREGKVRLPSLGTPPLAAGLACASLAFAVGGLYLQERRLNHNRRYTVPDQSGEWVTVNAPSGRRIGVAGLGYEPVYPMYGPRLRNQVKYVGPRVEGMLRAYRHRSDFQDAVARGRYDLVLLHRTDWSDPGPLPERHGRWLREMGYRPVARFLPLYRAPSRAGAPDAG
jgi:hypothetical protein